MRQLIYLAILLSIQFAQGQNNFRKGYIVTTAGDTITGEIKFNWNQKPTALNFRQGAFIKSYTVNDVVAFQLMGGDRFVQKTVEVDVSPTVVEKLLPVGEDPMESMNLFLKVLLLGEANLYQSYDEARQRFHYFIETKDTEGAVELIENRRKIPRDTDELRFEMSNIVGLVKTQDKYKGQLFFLLNDCDRSISEIQEMEELTQKTISKAIKNYNACSTNKSTYQQDGKLRGTNLKLGVLAGIQLFDIVLESQPIPEGLNTAPHLSPTIGLDLQFNFSNRRALSIGLQSFYSQFQTTETFFERRAVVSGFATINYQWQQWTNHLKFNYNFGVSDKFFFANTGFGVNFIGNATGVKDFDTGSQANLINQEKDRHLLITIGGGYQHKRLRGELGFDIGSSSKQLRFTDTRTLRLQVTYFIF